MDIKSIFKKQVGYSTFQKIVVYVAVLMILILLLLNVFVYNQVDDSRIHGVMVAIVLCFLYVISKKDEYARTDALLSLALSVFLVIAGIVSGVIYHFNIIFPVILIISGVLCFIVFLPHALYGE